MIGASGGAGGGERGGGEGGLGGRGESGGVGGGEGRGGWGEGLGLGFNGGGLSGGGWGGGVGGTGVDWLVTCHTSMKAGLKMSVVFAVPRLYVVLYVRSGEVAGGKRREKSTRTFPLAAFCCILLRLVSPDNDCWRRLIILLASWSVASFVPTRSMLISLLCPCPLLRSGLRVKLMMLLTDEMVVTVLVKLSIELMNCACKREEETG